MPPVDVHVPLCCRRNILERGEEFQGVFGELCKKYPKQLLRVTGSGLIQAVHISPSVPMFGGNHRCGRCTHMASVLPHNNIL